MTSIRHSFGRRVSLALIGALLLTLITPPGTVITARAGAQQGVKTVLAFPAVDESDEGNLEEAASRVTSALALAGRDVKEVDLEVFSETSPMVRRAIADGSLRRAEVEAPKDARTALSIGRAFRVDSVVLIGVQSLKIEGEPRTAEVAVMGVEYEVAINVDEETGTIVEDPKGNTFGVSGVSKARSRRGGDDRALIRLAAKSAAFKILHVLAGKTAEQYVEQGAEPKKRSNLWRWLAIALVIGGIIAATSNGGGGDAGGPAADELVPTRRTQRVAQDGIRLSWVRPATAKQIFSYQIQRQADGGVFVRVDNDKIGANATSFTDFNIVPGTAYVYQIRVIYTDGTRSLWMTFNQVQA